MGILVAQEASAIAGPGRNFKWVRNGNEYRFALLTGFGPNHADIQESFGVGPQATSAGFVAVYDNAIDVYGYSQSLGIGYGADDPENLSHIFGKPVKMHKFLR